MDKKELAIILRELQHRLEADEKGSIVEFGCYVGTTSLFIRRLLGELDCSHGFHVYDSFAGLPPKLSHDQSPVGEQFKTGELATAKKDFIVQFKKAGLRLPKFHKAWFNQLRSVDIPPNITFAFLDGDYYQSIWDSLKCIETKLAKHTVVIVDDYTNPALPGVQKAVTQWLRTYPMKLRVESSLAILQSK